MKVLAAAEPAAMSVSDATTTAENRRASRTRRCGLDDEHDLGCPYLSRCSARVPARPEARDPARFVCCILRDVEIGSGDERRPRDAASADAGLLRLLRGRPHRRGPRGDGSGAGRRGGPPTACCSWRATATGRPVGFAAVGWKWASTRGARIAVMEDLFVAPEARGQGAADALIEACADRAREHWAPPF